MRFPGSAARAPATGTQLVSLLPIGPFTFPHLSWELQHRLRTAHPQTEDAGIPSAHLRPRVSLLECATLQRTNAFYFQILFTGLSHINHLIYPSV